MAGSIRQQAKGTWELRVFLGRDATTGRKEYVSRTFRGTKREANRELARLVNQADDGRLTNSGRTVGELCERWYAHAEPNLSPTTARGYRRMLDQYVVPRWGTTPLRRLRTADLDVWYSKLLRSGGQRRQALSPASVRRIHAVLHRALRQGQRWGWLVVNPAANASPPKEHRHELTPPSADEVGAILKEAAVANPALPCYLRVAATTGARRGELCGLRWADVDLVDRQLVIRRSIVHGEEHRPVEKDTKNHAARRVTLDAGTAAALLEHRQRQTDLFSSAGVPFDDDAYVFSHEPDGSKPWRPDYASLAFYRVREALGLKHVRLHDLRHFSATQLLANGTDVRTVSGRLGHAKASTTLDIYAHFVEAADQQAAEVIGDILDGR